MPIELIDGWTAQLLTEIKTGGGVLFKSNRNAPGALSRYVYTTGEGRTVVRATIGRLCRLGFLDRIDGEYRLTNKPYHSKLHGTI